MVQAAKIIGTGLATTGLIGAGVGIGVWGCFKADRSPVAGGSAIW